MIIIVKKLDYNFFIIITKMIKNYNMKLIEGDLEDDII